MRVSGPANCIILRLILNITLFVYIAWIAIKSKISFFFFVDEFYHKEAPFALSGAVAAPATNYEKRPFVFRLKFSNGGESLFQTRSDDEMHQWVEALNAIAASHTDASQIPAASGLGRSATLPSSAYAFSTPEEPGSFAPTTTSGKSGTGKRKFLTMMRKKWSSRNDCNAWESSCTASFSFKISSIFSELCFRLPFVFNHEAVIFELVCFGCLRIWID